MITTQWLHAGDYPRMPWKNGGGFTEEITRDSGDGLDGFGWRLSIADIEESGGFSSFPDYQRIITVLQGDGMRLLVDGQASRPLLPLDAYAFKGESQVSCQLLGGPIRDFNLIYRPGRFIASLQWFDGSTRVFSSASTVLVFAASAQVEVHGAEVAALSFERHDCLRVDGNQGLLELQVQGRYCLIELTEKPL